MSLIIFDQVQFALGAAPLLDQCSFTIEKGERIALVGRNGAGKSTLLKLILGKHQPDAGNIKYAQGLKIGHLQQDLPAGDDRTVMDVVLAGAGEVGEALIKYQALLMDADPDLDHLNTLQEIIEKGDGWQFQNKAEAITTRLTLDPNKAFKALSGGWRRRVLLAQALVTEPDVLILDEPTNHLDIKMVEWLEELLLGYTGTLLFVSHDRSFIDRLATKVYDLDRGQISPFPAPYEAYLVAKEHALEVEAEQRAQQDKVLAREEVWIRQGIKARRTRNEGRVRALKEMRVTLGERQYQQGTAKFDVQSQTKSGKKVVELTDVEFAYGDSPIVRRFSELVMRGDKIALIGPNGIGKSTLLKIMLGELAPQAGEVVQGTKLEVAYFDQARMALDPEKTLIDSVSEGRDFIEVGGKNRHVISYLEDFLFKPERCRMKVKQLSGGETNRLLLARLFSLSANFLVLDEPTNDLDMDTLELLIDRLADFDGTVIMVSHDRYFIDQLATKTWAFEGSGYVRVYPGGYEDWKDQGGKWPGDGEKSTKANAGTTEAVLAKPAAKTKKRSYKEQREFDAMPAKIETLETELETLTAQVNAPDFYNSPSTETAPKLLKLEEIETELNEAYERWAVLESLVD